ncbi:MAG: ribosome recycling factor [bacterium]
MIEQIVKEAKPKMQLAIGKLSDDLHSIRTGRANASLLDPIMVSVYGAQSAIKEVASVTVPEANQIYIKPWDRNVLSGIETAIRNSDIGLSPINDGTAIRLVLPPMTEERRKAIALQAKKFGEEAKVVIRNIRGEVWGKVQSAEKKSEVTEDDRYWAEDELNKITNEMNKEVERIVGEKEKEILSI